MLGANDVGYGISAFGKAEDNVGEGARVNAERVEIRHAGWGVRHRVFDKQFPARRELIDPCAKCEPWVVSVIVRVCIDKIKLSLPFVFLLMKIPLQESELLGGIGYVSADYFAVKGVSKPAYLRAISRTVTKALLW